MNVRHAALGAGAILILGVGVYLLIEVRSKPAAANGAPASAVATNPEEEDRGAEARPARPGGAIRRPPGPLRGPTEGDGAVPDGEALPTDESGRPRPGPASRNAVAQMLRGRGGSADGSTAAMRQEAVMDEANRAYDRGEWDEAKTIAQRVLARQPNNIRMLRIVVSTSCMTGETEEAQRAFLLLPETDRAVMRTRCARYNVSFREN